MHVRAAVLSQPIPGYQRSDRMAVSRSTKVLILSSGQALTSLVGIVSTAVLARVFSQTDYASYRQTLLAYTFAVPFVTLGFDRALYYFLPGEEEAFTRDIGRKPSLALWRGALLSLFLVCGGNQLLAMRFNNPDLAKLLLLLVPYPLLMLPAASLSACLMARNRTEQVAGFNVGSRLLMLLAIVVPCLIWPNPSTAIIGTVIGAAVTTAAALMLMFRACNAGSWRPTLAGIRKQIRFSVPLGLATLVGTVSLSLDQVMVAAICAPAVFAVYVNGAMEIPLIGMITGSVTSVLMVDYARLFKEGRFPEIVELIHRAMVKCAVPSVPRDGLFDVHGTGTDASWCLGHPTGQCHSFSHLSAYASGPHPHVRRGASGDGHSRKILVSSMISLATNTCFFGVPSVCSGPCWLRSGQSFRSMCLSCRISFSRSDQSSMSDCRAVPSGRIGQGDGHELPCRTRSGGAQALRGRLAECGCSRCWRRQLRRDYVVWAVCVWLERYRALARMVAKGYDTMSAAGRCRSRPVA